MSTQHPSARAADDRARRPPMGRPSPSRSCRPRRIANPMDAYALQRSWDQVTGTENRCRCTSTRTSSCLIPRCGRCSRSPCRTSGTSSSARSAGSSATRPDRERCRVPAASRPRPPQVRRRRRALQRGRRLAVRDPDALPGARVGRGPRRALDRGVPGGRADHGRGGGDVVGVHPRLVGRRRGLCRAADDGPHPADGPAQARVPVPPGPVGVDGDPATPEAVAVLQPGQRPASGRLDRSARPADRRRPGEPDRGAVPEGRRHREAGRAGRRAADPAATAIRGNCCWSPVGPGSLRCSPYSSRSTTSGNGPAPDRWSICCTVSGCPGISTTARGCASWPRSGRGSSTRKSCRTTRPTRDARQGRHGRGPAGAVRAYGDGVRRPADGRAHAEQLAAAGMHPEHIKYEHFYYAAAGEHTVAAGATRSGDSR